MYLLKSFQKISQPTEQSIKHLGRFVSRFLGPVHVVNFFFRRGKTTIRDEQIIRKNGVQQMINGRFRHYITEIFMVFGVILNGDLGGGTVKFNQGFTVSTERGGGIKLAHT